MGMRVRYNFSLMIQLLRNIQIIKRVKKIINGKFFVIGDNARSFESSDSRSFGLLSESKIIGKLN